MGAPFQDLNEIKCCLEKKIGAVQQNLDDFETADAAATSFANRTLVGGAVVVADTKITANSILIISRKTAGGTPGTGHTYVLNPGVGVTITSTSGTDTSVISVLTKY